MEYLIRFIQMQESFRKPETDALAELAGLELQWVFYSEDSPFAVIRFVNEDDTNAAAIALITRSILTSGIYELWGSGTDYPTLHDNVRQRTSSIWNHYRLTSFRFEIDSFQGSHSTAEQKDIIETFSYTGFEGPIKMTNPDNQFVVFEDHDLNVPIPKKLYLGRLIAESDRKPAIAKYTLKKRSYIATTSMDAELSLVTANLALASAGKVAYDPFMGTGSFPLACAHFGASVLGSDLDGRSIRGKKGRSVRGNFEQYGTSPLYLGGFVADLTNTPLRTSRWLDAIICDPPYGVREGLKVLGSAKPALKDEVLLANGTPAHLSDSYLPPKKPYSFVRMLSDVLDFSADMLVDGGRLCMWMPVAGIATAEDEVGEERRPIENEEYSILQHPGLELMSECTQHFNKWSRRLLTYRRRRGDCVDPDQLLTYKAARLTLESEGDKEGRRGTADDLNAFRRKYFQGFRDPSLPRRHEKLPHTY